MKLVLYPTMDEERFERLRASSGDLTMINCQDEQEAVKEMAAADAFFGKLTPQLLEPAAQLKWVQSPTASLEHYLFPELVSHPCILTNMRGLFYDVIADHVFGYVLMFARRLNLYLRQQIERRWSPVGGEEERSNFALGPSHVSAMDRAHIHLSDCTMGIIGLGSIGSEIARRAAAFSMQIRAVDPQVTQCPEEVDRLDNLDGLPELLAESDFVVIAAPHTPETESMFGAEQFGQMKKNAYLINIGRGVIVQLDALTEALSSGEIAGAGLDVFETEPLPADHPLWGFENTILTPHVAACSPHIAPRHFQTLADNVKRFAAGEPLSNIVDKTAWY